MLNQAEYARTHGIGPELPGAVDDPLAVALEEVRKYRSMYERLLVDSYLEARALKEQVARINAELIDLAAINDRLNQLIDDCEDDGK